MHSTVISKFYARHKSEKNKNGTPKNVAAEIYENIIYIGSRPGVDLTPVSEEILSGALDSSEESAEQLYAQYTKTSESEVNGLWGNFDVCPLRGAARLASHQIDKGKTVFQGILSIREDDAIELGYDQKKNWIYLARQAMPEIAKTLNIPLKSINWCMALHMEQGHIHCHYDVWNSDEEIRKPYVSQAQKQQIRETFSNIIFEQERLEHEQDETLQRDLLVSLTDKLSSAALGQLFHPETSYIPQGFLPEDIAEYIDKFHVLLKYLPEKGKMQYGYMPYKVKQLLDQFTDSALSLPSLSVPYQRLLNSCAKKRSNASANTPATEVSILKVKEDIHRRLGNRILMTCRQLIDDRERLLQQWEKHFPQSSLPAEDETFCNDLPFEDTFTDNSVTTVNSYAQDNTNTPKTAFSFIWSKEYKEGMKLLYDLEATDKSQALALLQAELAQNNILAIDAMAKLYDKGIYVEKCPDTAQNLYRKALQGFKTCLEDPDGDKVQYGTRYGKPLRPPSQSYLNYRVGRYYEHGLGTEANLDKAVECYQLAAGNMYADYALGSMYLRGKVIELTEKNKPEWLSKSAALFKSSANQGFGYAAYSYSKLAESELSLCVSNEEIEKYYKLAFQYFSDKLNTNPSDDLYYRIGTMYYSGNGVEKDSEKAYMCFLKAAEFNNKNAQYALGKTYSDSDSVHYNLTKAVEMFTLSAGQDNDYAHLALGRLYLNKKTVLWNPRKAICEFEAVLETQYSSANYYLGTIYSDKDSGLFNPDKAITHLSAACKEGNAFAQYSLGKLYLDETLPSHDFSTGFSFLNLAAEQNNPFAQIKIGCLYLWGHGRDLPKNEALGKYWLYKAMEQGNDTAKEFAQKSLNMYQNYRNKLVLGLTYRLLLDAAQIISSQKRQLSDPYAAIASKVKTRESIKDSKKKKDREK